MLGVMGIDGAFMGAGSQAIKNKDVIKLRLNGDAKAVITCYGGLRVESVNNGQPVVAHYSNLLNEEITILSDANIEATLIGNIFSLAFEQSESVVGLDVVSSRTLEEIEVRQMLNIKTLSIADATALTDLTIDDTPSIDAIYTRAIRAELSNAVASYITYAASQGTTGNVYLLADDPYYSIIADAATNANWTVNPLLQ